jgi:TrmH family RNA methyltransferase
VRTALREHDQEIAIEGPKQVADAIAQGWKPLATIVRGGAPAFLPAISQDAGMNAGAPLIFDPALFDLLAETRSPQNVIALFERPCSSFADMLKRRDSVIVALDGVQDPGNVGTIVRLAAAFDCAGVALLPGCADPFAPKVIRSSVGAVLNVPIANVTHEELVASKLPLFAASLNGRTSQPPACAAILVFGSEGTGVSEGIARVATPIPIPMSPRVESLNVATSAAILLSRSYELRQG